MIDLIIVVLYFSGIMLLALRGRNKTDELTAESYFLSSRNLRWPSIALSTIATNIQGYQFLGMMGSAYLYGLAQANLEINAVQGILLATFVFVPLYLREKVITITQYFKLKLGARIALFYSISNILLFSTITLGAALFWGAYAADLVFGEWLSIIHSNRTIRIMILIVFLGIFSCIYTYLGGLSAVVKTDILQFLVLITGGVIILFVSIHHLGGWSELYAKTGDKMHLHLPADHEKLPWIHMFGLFFLNINYWCANQTVIQRSLAARSLREAQIGLMAGGVLKYFMAVIIIVPGIALYGILQDKGITLDDPDKTFPYLVSEFLPWGLKGIVLCALFASLMSTVDSTFNSIATLWSVDIYKSYINKEATDIQMVSAGKKVILMSLITGLAMGFFLLWVKFNNPENAFTHTLNELRYYINCGIVVLICSAVFIIAPKRKVVLAAFLLTIPIQLFLKAYFPEMNYFVRAGWVVVFGLSVVILFGRIKGIDLWPAKLKIDKDVKITGWCLLVSLVLIHFIFH